jgi:hypothetical protein
MQKKIVAGLLILIGLAGMFVYFRWSSAIRQPLDFSHARHVRSKIECSQCHGAGTLDSLPQTNACRSCHTDQSFPTRVEWVRVYRVAPDIIFSHRGHTNDPCAVCHKDLAAGKQWIHESRFTMDFCMDCHAQRRADNSCGACHKNR